MNENIFIWERMEIEHENANKYTRWNVGNVVKDVGEYRSGSN